MKDEKTPGPKAGTRQEQPNCLGILLTNLGTPKAPEPKALRHFLAEFLSDRRVIELPRWLWWPILHGFILRARPRRSARAYRKVWREDGSPLLVIGREQAAQLQIALDETMRGSARVELAMRYGEPDLEHGLEALWKAGARRILVLPLFPQYSATTTASIFDKISLILRQWRWIPELRFVTSYHEHPEYIQALATRIQDYWSEHGRGERLLMSFHGIPQSYTRAGDPYQEQCMKTGQLLARALGLEQDEWQVSFQSRFGAAAWLQPYTDETLREWGRRKIGRVDVTCPGFAADCLETLEEIAMQNRTFFQNAGGGEFHYISALNARPEHTALLTRLVRQHGLLSQP